jgi:hypothetical protein
LLFFLTAQRKLSRKTKLYVFSIVLWNLCYCIYGFETWTVTNAIALKLKVFINICLSQIQRIRWPEFVTNFPILLLLWERYSLKLHLSTGKLSIIVHHMQFFFLTLQKLNYIYCNSAHPTSQKLTQQPFAHRLICHLLSLYR